MFFYIAVTLLLGMQSYNLNGQINANYNSTINDLIFAIHSIKILGYTIPYPAFTFFTAALKLMTWDYPVFSGWWNVVRLLFLLPVSFVMSNYLIVVVSPVLIGFMQAIAVALGAITGKFTGILQGLGRF